MSSYHENGSVASLNVKAGKITIEEDAFVGVIAVDKDATSSSVKVQNSGIVFATEVITYKADLAHEVIDNPTEAQSAIVNTVETTSTSDTIKIGSADALINLASAQSQGIVVGALKIELTSDIDLSGKTWIPFGADLTKDDHHEFNGTIDGKNYKIIGMSNGSYRGVQIANGTTGQIGEHYGFIANAGTVAINNLSFTSVNINSDSATVCGAVVAYAESSNVTLNNVKVEGNITGADKVAGLIGYAKVDSTVVISNCLVNANLTAHEYRIGGYLGFVADNTTVSISNSSFGGSIVAENSTNKTPYIGAIGSIHQASASSVTGVHLTVSKFTVLEGAQIQDNPALAANKKVSTSNGKVLVAIMTGTVTTSGITDNVVTGQDFMVSVI